MRIGLFFILAFFSSLAYSDSDSTPNAQSSYQLETLSQGLNYPWSIAFLPTGDFLVAQRDGELRRISSTGDVGDPISNTPASYISGQGGYFDVLLDPDFANNNKLYLSFAHGSKEANATRIVSAILEGNSLSNIAPIFTVSPSKDTNAHYGGRMVFLKDGTLVLTTGDGFQYREAAQDRFSQLGKTVRMNTDGSVPANNPYANGQDGNAYVYSYGHRSPQGLSYDSTDNILYLHEHGPKGGDEVNVIAAKANYGWPATSYGINYSGARISPHREWSGITNPITKWVPSIAPSGLAYYNGESFPQWKNSLFVGALVDKDVKRLALKDGKVISEESLFSEIGERIRDVRVGPDDNLYILTDSDTGQLIRVSPR